jgi:hypothetical protein
MPDGGPDAPSVVTERFRLPWYVKLASALVLLAAPTGFVHCVCDGARPMMVCWKESWGLRDTLVDVNDYTGKNRFELIDEAPIVRSLHSCGVLVWNDETPAPPPASNDTPAPKRRDGVSFRDDIVPAHAEHEAARAPAFYCDGFLCSRVIDECKQPDAGCAVATSAFCYDMTGDAYMESCYATKADCLESRLAKDDVCEERTPGFFCSDFACGRTGLQCEDARRLYKRKEECAFVQHAGCLDVTSPSGDILQESCFSTVAECEKARAVMIDKGMADIPGAIVGECQQR